MASKHFDKMQKLLFDETIFNTFDKELEYSKNKVFYHFNKYKVLQENSHSGKTKRFYLTADNKNMLAIELTPHFIERFNERIHEYSDNALKNIIGNIYTQYIGEYKCDDKYIKIKYPFKKCWFVICAEQGLKYIKFRTCYKRSFKKL